MNIISILPTFGDTYKSARVIQPDLNGDPVQYFKLQKNKGSCICCGRPFK